LRSNYLHRLRPALLPSFARELGESNQLGDRPNKMVGLSLLALANIPCCTGKDLWPYGLCFMSTLFSRGGSILVMCGHDGGRRRRAQSSLRSAAMRSSHMPHPDHPDSRRA